MFQYLLATAEVDVEDTRPSRPTAVARRRKSDNLITNLAEGQDQPVPDLFNLVDLIMTSLRSSNQQTVTATLRLVCVLLRNRHQYHFSLFKIRPMPHGNKTSTGQDDQDVQFLFSIAEDLADFDSLRASYQAHLHDVQSSIEHHECSAQILSVPGFDSNAQTIAVPHQSIEITDTLLLTLIGMLKGFMANDVETNLSLTQAISTLALCGSVSLRPWLLSASCDVTVYNLDLENDEAPDNDQDQTLSDRRCAEPQETSVFAHPGVDNRSQPTKPMRSLSPLLEALDCLKQDVERFHSEIHNFDIYLAERKHIFQVGDEIDEAGTVVSDTPESRRSEDLGSNITKPRLASAHLGSIPQRLRSAQSSNPESRASSPRGRRIEAASAPAAGRLSHLHIPPSPQSPPSDSRGFPSSPLRKSSVSATPPRRTATPIGPADAPKQKVKVWLPFPEAESSSKRGSRDLSRSKGVTSETSSLRSASLAPGGFEGRSIEHTEVGLSQVLTNVIILQEFVLELAAIIGVRARLFGEMQ